MTGYGVDLGTANTVIYHPRRGVVLDEPSLMVIRPEVRPKRIRPVLVGNEAQALLGRCPVGLTAVRPLQDGVIVDLEAARAFLAAIVAKVPGPPWRHTRPRAVIGVPAGATALERRALLEAAGEAHLRRTELVPEPIAGAIGCGLDPLDASTHLVLDIGGGTSEVTAFCFGGVLAHRCSRTAGNELTLALYQYLRTEHQLVVGEVSAERLKCQVSEESRSSLVAQGVDAASGRPQLVTLGVEEVMEALRPTLSTILSTLAGCLDDLSPQAVDDVMNEGVWAFGGGALIRGFGKLLQDALAFPVRIPDRPLTCVAEGAAHCLHLPRLLDAYQGSVAEAG